MRRQKPYNYVRKHFTTTAKTHRLLADPGTPGILRVRYRVCSSAEYLLIGVVFKAWS